MYIPAVRSIPLFEEEGEFQAEAGVSTNSVYLNGSYALPDNIAVSINGNVSYRNFTNRYDIFTHKDEPGPKGGRFFDPVDTRGKFAHRYGEISIGRINMLPPKAPKLEVFGGVGMGRATDFAYWHYKSDYYSVFGQVNVGIKKQVVEAGASFRLAFSNFDYVVNQDDNEEALFQNSFQAFHLEPMGFVRTGQGNFKFIVRYGLNLAFSNVLRDEFKGYHGFDAPIGNKGWGNTFFHISIGVSYRIKGNF